MQVKDRAVCAQKELFMGKVTNKDIAERAGVSAAAVSLAIHGRKGLHAGNFDITHIFMDNLYKLAQSSDPKETENFLDWCSVFSAENSVAFTLTIAGEAAEAPEYIARYMD